MKTTAIGLWTVEIIPGRDRGPLRQVQRPKCPAAGSLASPSSGNFAQEHTGAFFTIASIENNRTFMVHDAGLVMNDYRNQQEKKAFED